MMLEAADALVAQTGMELVAAFHDRVGRRT